MTFFNKNSIHSVQKRHEHVQCETSLRHHLKKLDLEKLMEVNNKILIHKPIETLKLKYEFAIDFTNDPYY